jgi:FkbM family methyltransferase
MSSAIGGRVDPYLSVVVTTRNDDHGGDPLKRLQALVNTFDEQCRRNRLDAELIVVEWNPLADRSTVASLLVLPEQPFCTYRFIEVPPSLHQRLQYADVLPLFQMIAKNVGIRRARGQFVLATNIDIIFSNELMAYIGSRQLQPGHLYRVDRHDIEPNLPLDAPLDAQIDYCRNHQLRVHTRWGSFPVDSSGLVRSLPEDIADGQSVRLGRGWHVKEGGAASGGRCYRWASERVELIVNAQSVQWDGPTVLDVEIQSNPYDASSWVETVALVDGREVARTTVAGAARLLIPIDREKCLEECRIELRVGRTNADSIRQLPAFERRDALYYRVVGARLRQSTGADHERVEYARSGWTNAYEGSGVELNPTPDGLGVVTDRRKYSYCVDYGPLGAPHAGLYRFDVTCAVMEGGISIGVLNKERNWLPASVNRLKQDGTTRFEIALELKQDDIFWIVVANDHPEGVGVSRFVISRLAGPASPLGTPRKGPPKMRRLLRESWRRQAGRIADAAGRMIASLLGRRLRYRVARIAPEFAAVENALRNSDDQLRALAPLQYLTDFNTFVRARRPDNLHVNGCGDFQLMAREHWDELRGYPEFETFSMNIDGLFSYVADAAGIKEVVLEMEIYHLEHEVGSGWSPEGEALLRKRIAERGITWLDASTVYIWAAYMKWLGRPMIFNGSGWGFAAHTLPERDGSSSTEAHQSPESIAARHPVFHLFGGFDGWAEPGFERSFYGSNIRDWLYTGVSKGLTDRRHVHIEHPPVDEEYFEWIALLTAVENARGRFCFAELGAGWGRWMVSAAVVCRQKSLALSLIGVEPEPSHFEWLRMALQDNDINPDEHQLFLGAVGSREGEVLLAGPDEPRTTYGNRAIGYEQLPAWEKIEGFIFRPVPSVTLETLFAKHASIDLVDMDVQGTEAEIVASGIDVLNRKVRMIHIGTHSAEVEAELTTLFSTHGWLKGFAFPAQTKTRTPFGIVTFGDGAQTWVNPREPELHRALVSCTAS